MVFIIALTLIFLTRPYEDARTFYTCFKTTNSGAVQKVVDISGHWEGIITRDEGGGKRTTYTMDLDITQKGKDIKGISYVHFDDGTNQYHAKMEVIGKINGTYLKYLETKILNADPIPNADWCVKKADLIHKIIDTAPTLEGIWEGATTYGTCVPGRIFLQKKPPRV